MPEIIHVCAELFQNLTPRDADMMMMIGAVCFAVPQLVLAMVWLAVKEVTRR